MTDAAAQAPDRTPKRTPVQEFGPVREFGPSPEFGDRRGMGLAESTPRTLELVRTVPTEALRSVDGELRRRLVHDILPLWSVVGLRHEAGGFAETLSEDGRTCSEARRVRVTARQLYAFSQAPRFGWNEAASRSCVRHAYRFLCAHSSAEGFLVHTLDSHGEVLDPGFELYDQAFLLLAYASAFATLRDPDIAERAHALCEHLRLRFANGARGLKSRLDSDGRLLANPHMHLLEAALAWMEVEEHDEWRELADHCVALLRDRFYDGEDGTIIEAFDITGRRVEVGGRHAVEPGHHFEWAWLLMRWADLTGAPADEIPDRLIAFAEDYGYDRGRHVVANIVWSDGTMADANARLWPQTERLKAWLAVARRAEADGSRQRRVVAEGRAADSGRALLAYLDTSTPGVWYDVMDENGRLAPCAAPASSLYHIVCALDSLRAYCGAGR